MTEHINEPTNDQPIIDEPVAVAQPRKRNRLRTLIAVLAALAVTAGVIVGTVALVRNHQADVRHQAAAAAAAKAEADRKAAEAKHQAEIKACQDTLGDYIESLSDIDARLDVGLKQETLSDLAGQASIEGSHVDEGDLTTDFCKEAKDKADDALTEYASTVDKWDNCIWDDWCDPDIDLDLQGPWARASDAIGEAKDLMDGKGGDGA